MNTFKFALIAMLMSVLTACGGGGGSSGATAGSSGSGGSGSTGGSTGTVTSVTPTVVVSIVNSLGAQVNNIQVGSSYSAKVLVKDASGNPVNGRLVAFSIDGSIATLGSTSALTNSSGEANVTIGPASISSSGATTLRADAIISGVGYSGALDFGVSAGSISLSAIRSGAANLASAGNTSLEITALLSGIPTTLPVNVVWTASCGLINGLSAVSPGVSVTTNGSGIAAASYQSVNADGSLCSGAVALTANTAGLVSAVQGSLTIQAPVANAIAFLSATPNNIFVSGSGAADRSLVKFRVFSSTGSPLQNVSVTFSITTNPGGVGIGSIGSVAPVSVTSDASGDVSINVFSGLIPGPVKLRAALFSNTSIFSESQNLSVASGPPSQKFMDLSVSTFNIEGWVRSGSSTQLTVRIADRQGNAVEDGTVINFTAEGGQIASSCATSRSSGISSCSVDFISQNPRPAGGRVAVLAYLEGDKDYTDNDGSNSFTVGDTLVEMGDAYRDDNEDGMYGAANDGFVFPRGGVTTCLGAGGSVPSRANTCDGKLRTTVRAQTSILFSSSEPSFETVSISTGSIRLKVRSVNNTLLPMPAGTIITAEGVGGTCAVEKQVGSPVVNVLPGTNPFADLATTFSATLKTCVVGNAVDIKVQSPSGLVTTTRFIL